MSNTRSMRWGCWALLAALAAGLAVVLILGGGGALYYYWSRPPASIHVAVQSPGSVRMNQEYTLRIAVTNDGAETVRVDEIRLPKSVLATADVVDVGPSSTGYLDEDGILVCRFDQSIDPSATVVFSIILRAQRDGDISGPVEVLASGTSAGTDLNLQVSSATTTPGRFPTGTSLPQPDAEKLRPVNAVVMIVALARNDAGRAVPVWGGSGTILTPDGYILTNYHVAVGNDSETPVAALEIHITQDPEKAPTPKYYAEVVESDRDLDLAVIRIVEDKAHKPIDPQALDLPWVPIGDADALNIGDPLIILGYPMIGGNTVTITEGVVSGFTEKRSWIKTDASISGGNSGGLALNLRGELVGIPTQLGSGAGSPITDCRIIADTNNDGYVNQNDTCVPAGGFINAIRPINVGYKLIENAIEGMAIAAGAASTPTSPAGRLLLWEDFSDPLSGWTAVSADKAAVRYEDGLLTIRSAGGAGRVLARPRLWYRDTRMEVRVTALNGAEDGSVGLVCRYRGEGDYYYFQMDRRGRLSIGLMLGGAPAELASTQKEEWIRDGSVPFTLRADCAGMDLFFYIDGMLAVAATDESLGAGDIALFGEAPGSGSADIALDELFLYNP